MNTTMILRSCMAGGVALAVVAGAHAQRQRPPGPPPTEAFEACRGLDAGEACAFDHRGRTVEGVCITPPEREQLVCAPEQPPGARPGRR